jgi:hypothetical protein
LSNVGVDSVERLVMLNGLIAALLLLQVKPLFLLVDDPLVEKG